MALTGKGWAATCANWPPGSTRWATPGRVHGDRAPQHLTILMDFCRERGLGGEQVAAQFEALAARIRSGEAATAARDYRAELVRLGHAVILPRTRPPHG